MRTCAGGRSTAYDIMRRTSSESAGSQRSSMTLKQKWLPLSTSLSTRNSPFMSSASCLEMASPSPVPPYDRVVEESTCTKKRSGV